MEITDGLPPLYAALITIICVVALVLAYMNYERALYKWENSPHGETTCETSTQPFITRYSVISRSTYFIMQLHIHTNTLNRIYLQISTFLHTVIVSVELLFCFFRYIEITTFGYENVLFIILSINKYTSVLSIIMNHRYPYLMHINSIQYHSHLPLVLQHFPPFIWVWISQ